MDPSFEFERALLILDLDETLVRATEKRLDRPEDFRAGQYYVYKRPHLDSFLQTVAGVFKLGVWSAGTQGYVESTVNRLLPPEVEPLFVWSRLKCVRRSDLESKEAYFVKDLRKTRRFGFPLERTMIVEDMARQVERHYGNAVYVKPYLGEATDNELLLLARYLLRLYRSAANFRTIEKRNWRQQQV
ncbi:MAG: HAD family hydrolase [Candidatus Obscuribacterales bacterium]|jgi:TFIIF-interacting CTD phosphatase-like protein|nr:HAD family hydrolase [Candidatus Obscuribacterales bacterium]